MSQGGVNNAHIDRAASFVTGIAAINNSTGAQNAQANGVVLYDPANGTGSGSSSATQNVTQQYGSGSTRGNTVVISGTQSSDIGTAGNAHGSPMYGGQGLGAINNTSGASNQQANAVFLNNAALGSSGMQNQSSSSGQSFTGSGSSNSDLTTTANSTSNIQGNTGATSTGAILLNSGAGAANSQYNEMYLNNGSSGGGSSTTNQTLNQSISTASASVDGSTNTGNISDQVGQNVNGYVAANSAGGAGNQQGNQLIVLMNSSASKQVTPTVGVSQTDTATVNGSSTNNATLNGAFQNVKGAASANVAGGAFNQQGNTILVTDGTLSGVSPTVSQQTNVSVSSSPGSTNTGAIGGGAFAGSSGAVSANVAAGAGNVQSNVIVLGNH